MLELSPARKNKINLADYNWRQDVENRILMSDFSMLDVAILQEIVFSPLKLPFRKLLRNLDCKEEELSQSLAKFAAAGLLTIQGDTILVDKDKRKHFEFQITRFDEEFKPDMEFVQGLLKKVPIHLLPLWYATPRTSNNLFESIVEKYLLTPHIFQRYLSELNLGEPLLMAIMKDLFSSPELKLSTSDTIAKYNLKREDFEEAMLLLEFNFVCCVCYEKQDDHWLEVITPFHEWREYLLFLRSTETPRILSSETVVSKNENPFAFVEEMSHLLMQVRKKPLAVPSSHALQKLCMTKLAEYEEGVLRILETGEAWLDLSLENRSLYLYRNPHNRILSLPAGERYVREAEKAVKRVLHGDWVYFDEFLKGVLVPLDEASVITLKKVGKQWKYTLPAYNDQQMALIKAVVFEWLYEMGMTQTGTHNGREVFCLTHFGRFFFED